MISLINGEVSFSDGLFVGPHVRLRSLSTAVLTTFKLKVPGWSQYVLGIHESDWGRFLIEVSIGNSRRVEAVYLSHCHEFYESDTPEDRERRVYHEAVMASDLRGQLEFSWGQVFCRYNPQMKRDWLMLVYNPFANVPLQARSIERIAVEHELFSRGRD